MRKPPQRRDPKDEQAEIDAYVRNYPHDVPGGPERRALWREIGGGETGQNWSTDDVEEIARATVDDSMAAFDVHDKIGPFPPDAFLDALGKRVFELMREKHGITREDDLETRQP
jgi:hypothetical protein